MLKRISMQRRYVGTESVKQQMAKVIELKKLGVSNRNIAKRFGVSESFLGQLLKVRYPNAQL